MLQYERIDISEGIDFDKSNKSKECMIYTIYIIHMFVINVMIYQWLFKI